MRKFLVWFGGFSVLVVVLVIGSVAYLVYLGSGLDKQSKEYADTAIVAITSHWDPAELSSRAAPQLLRTVSQGQLLSMFTWFGHIGKLVKYIGSKGSSTVFASIGGNDSTTATYVCAGKYENGDASVNLSLTKVNGDWRISGFQVNSPVLLPKPDQKS